MPSVTKLVRLATLPETRRLIGRASRSGALRRAGHLARTDRAALLRNLVDPAAAPRRARGAIAHPAARELASVGLVLLPARYLPIGWAAAWLSRRLQGRGSNR